MRFGERHFPISMGCTLLMIMILVVILQPVPVKILEASAPGLIRYHTDKWAVLPKVAGSDGELSVRLDGRLNDPIWSQAATMNGFKTAYFERPVDNIEYKLTYDDHYLYVGGTMSLNEAESLQKIDIIIKPSPARPFYYVASVPITDHHPESSARLNPIWNPTGLSLSSDVGRVNLPRASTGRVHVSGVVSDVFEDASNLSVEVAIPLGFVDAGGVKAGDEWQLNIAHVHHLYTKPLTSWLSVRHSNQWDTGHSERGSAVRMIANVIGEGRTGSIFFGGVPDYVTHPERVPSADQFTPAIADLRLAYIDFTTKRVLFLTKGQSIYFDNMLFRWQSPDEPWQTVAVSDIQQDGSSMVADITHPKPTEDGIYKLMIQYVDGNDDLHTLIVTFDREYLVEAGIETMSTSSVQIPERKIEWAEPSEEVQKIMSLIPPQPGIQFSGLPERPELDPREGLFQVGPDLRSLVALPTGTTYLGEVTDYQPNKAIPFNNRKGEVSSYPYYEDEDGRPHHLTGLLWHYQKSRVISEAVRLSSVDPLGAARILYELAQTFDGWHPNAQQRGSWFARPVPADSGPPYPYWGALWTHFWWGELGTVARLATAYENVKRTNAFQILSNEVGEDVERKIVEDMIFLSIDFTSSQPPGRGNLASGRWRGLIQIGRALNDPDLIHRAVDMIDKYLAENRFLFDGFWHEISASYHRTTISGLNNAINLLQGWSDPEGYVSPRTGTRFDDLDVGEQYPFIYKANELVRMMVYPDGKMLPLTDTWPNTQVSNAKIDTGPFLLPAAKLARLTSGVGSDQTQLNVNFQPKYGHVHRDGINFTLYADGRELIPDIGYSLSKYMWFVTSTMSHNTVIVDGADMTVNDHSRHGGNIESFVTSPLFQFTRIGYDRAYASVREYARELWYIPFSTGDDRESYILDIFRVDGGQRHEYTLQGDANRDAVFETDLSTSFYGPYLLPEEVKVTEPTSRSTSGSAEGHYPGYIYVRDVERADVLDDQFTLELLVSETGVDVPRLKITGLLDDDRNELYLGRSPSLRLGRLHGSSFDDNHSVDQHTMPKMVLRREGENLRSDFVTVLEPFYGGERSRIDVIERLSIDEGPEGSVAVRLVYGDTVDIILSNPHHDRGPLVAGDLELHGESGFIRLRDGVIREMNIVGGTLLQKGIALLRGQERVTGTVIGTQREADGDGMNALIVDVPIRCNPPNHYAIVTHPDGSTTGFKIGRINRDGHRTVIELAEHEPGFVVQADGSSRQTFYPWKEWNQPHIVEIVPVRWLSDMSSEKRDEEKTTTLHGTVYDASGKPFTGAVVNVAGYGTVTTISDDDGTFYLSGVPHGKQWIKVSHPLYEAVVSGPWDVGERSPGSISLTLGERLPPKLIGTGGEMYSGQMVTVTSNVDSTIYLVRGIQVSGVSEEVLKNIAVMEVKAEANKQVSFHIGDQFEGGYVLYAADEGGRVSNGLRLDVKDPEFISLGDFENIEVDDGNFPVNHRHVGGDTYHGEVYVDDTVARSGTKSLYIEGTGHGDRHGFGLNTSVITRLKGGETYKATLWYRAPELLADPSSGEKIRFQLNLAGVAVNAGWFWESDWVSAPPSDATYRHLIDHSTNRQLSAIPINDLAKQDPDDSTDWEELTMIFTLPDHFENITIIMNIYNRSEHPLWIDDLSFRKL